MYTVALVPAHDEADRIAVTVAAVLTVPGIDHVLVIDDGSVDSTATLAATAGAQVVRLARNVGKGGALQAGLDRVRDEADVVLLLDADLGATASEASKLLEPLLAGTADMTIAILPRPVGSGGFGLVKGLARFGIARLGGGFKAAAPLSGQRALTRQALDAVTPFAAGYGAEVALTIRALRARLRVVEVPATMAHAATGKDLAGFMHRGGQFVDVAFALVRLGLRRR